MPVPVNGVVTPEIRREPNRPEAVRAAPGEAQTPATAIERPGQEPPGSLQQTAEPSDRAPVPSTDIEQLRRDIEAVNGDPSLRDRNLGFQVDEELGRTLISVVDLETEETVRQIPSEEVVELARRLQEYRESLQSGGNPAPALGTVISLQA